MTDSTAPISADHTPGAWEVVSVPPHRGTGFHEIRGPKDEAVATLFPGAVALGHTIEWKARNYTMDSFPAIAWKEPHPYAGMREPCPRWTGSLDAAVTLVPDGKHLDLHDWTWPEEPCWSASIQTSKGPMVCVFAKAATAAAAMTAACLRARAALLKETT